MPDLCTIRQLWCHLIDPRNQIRLLGLSTSEIRSWIDEVSLDILRTQSFQTIVSGLIQSLTVGLFLFFAVDDEVFVEVAIAVSALGEDRSDIIILRL